MKSTTLLALLGIVVLAACAHADCGDSNSSGDGEVTTWLKNLGCKVQKGAEGLGETVKPYAEKLGSTAKDIGSSVVQKYDELKHKLTDDNTASSTPDPLPYVHAPTENVPLAPLSGGAPAAPVSAAAAPLDHVAAPAASATVTDA